MAEGVNYAAIERCLRDGDIDAAGQLLDAGLRSLPDDPRLLFLRAIHCERRGLADEAMALYGRSLQRNPASPQAHNNLGFL